MRGGIHAFSTALRFGTADRATILRQLRFPAAFWHMPYLLPTARSVRPDLRTSAPAGSCSGNTLQFASHRRPCQNRRYASLRSSDTAIRPYPDIRHARILGAADHTFRHISTLSRRYHILIQSGIAGGKSQDRAPQLISVNNLAPDHIRSAHHIADLFHPAITDQPADQRAADHFSVHLYRIDNVNVHAFAAGILRQTFRSPRSLKTVSEIKSASLRRFSF